MIRRPLVFLGCPGYRSGLMAVPLLQPLRFYKRPGFCGRGTWEVAVCAPFVLSRLGMVTTRTQGRMLAGAWQRGGAGVKASKPCFQQSHRPKSTDQWPISVNMCWHRNSLSRNPSESLKLTEASSDSPASTQIAPRFRPAQSHNSRRLRLTFVESPRKFASTSSEPCKFRAARDFGVDTETSMLFARHVFAVSQTLNLPTTIFAPRGATTRMEPHAGSLEGACSEITPNCWSRRVGESGRWVGWGWEREHVSLSVGRIAQKWSSYPEFCQNHPKAEKPRQTLVELARNGPQSSPLNHSHLVEFAARFASIA